METYYGNYDLIENLKKLNYNDFGYIKFVKVTNTNLKKNCYYEDETYDVKEYNYVLKDTDTYYGCYFEDLDESTDFIYNTSTGITGVDFSKATNLISIGMGAFSENEIEFVTFGNLPKLTSIGVSTFAYNQISGTVDLSGLTNILKIKDDLFRDNNIAKVIFPNNIVEIEPMLFMIMI